MNLKLLGEFALVFVVAVLVGAIATSLYDYIVHGLGAINWQTTFTVALVLGIVLTLRRAREDKDRSQAT